MPYSNNLNMHLQLTMLVFIITVNNNNNNNNNGAFVLADFIWYSETDSYYILRTETVTWATARDTCVNDGGELLVPQTHEEQDYLLQFVQRHTVQSSPDTHLWLGVACENYDACAMNAQWMSFWHDQYPSVNGQNTAGVWWINQNTWIDVPDAESKPEYICKYNGKCDSQSVVCDSQAACIQDTAATDRTCLCEQGFAGVNCNIALASDTPDPNGNGGGATDGISPVSDNGATNAVPPFSDNGGGATDGMPPVSDNGATNGITDGTGDSGGGATEPSSNVAAEGNNFLVIIIGASVGGAVFLFAAIMIINVKCKSKKLLGMEHEREEEAEDTVSVYEKSNFGGKPEESEGEYD